MNKAHSIRTCVDCGTMVGTVNGATVNLSQQYVSGYYSRGSHAVTCDVVSSVQQAEWNRRDKMEINRKVGARYVAMIKASDLPADIKAAKIAASIDRLL